MWLSSLFSTNCISSSENRKMQEGGGRLTGVVVSDCYKPLILKPEQAQACSELSIFGRAQDLWYFENCPFSMQTGSGTQLFEKGQNFISFFVAFVAHSCTMYSPAVDCCSVLFGIRPTATAVPSGSGTYLLKPLAILLLLYDTYLLFICMMQDCKRQETCATIS